MIYRLTLTLAVAALACLGPALAAQPEGRDTGRLSHRWLFTYDDMREPAEVDRVISLFPRAQAAGFNGVVFPANVAESSVEALREAAKQYRLALIPLVMEHPQDHNNIEGVPSRDALFVAHDGIATFLPDNPTKLLGGDFENAVGNRFPDWSFQDNEGVSSFADHEVMHGGRTSLRMENFAAGPHGSCHLSQSVKLQPYRQYHISIWVKTSDLDARVVEVEVIAPEGEENINFQTFGVQDTQDWTRYNLGFNSLDHTDAIVYVGVRRGKSGRVWVDDLVLEEVGLVNVLSRPGCPVTVRGEDGHVYQEGKDFEKIFDPNLNVWTAYHEPPVIHLTPTTRIKEGERLRVSYYHPVLINRGKVTWCLTEPSVFESWREQIERVNRQFHPPAFFMNHDEVRVANWCESCRSKHMTAGQLLAENIRRCAAIIREVRPDAEIWEWNDMFDPMMNARDPYFLCREGGMLGSWEGLDKDIGIVNWATRMKGRNCRFFADRGEKQILAGYYDHDEDGSGIAEWLRNTENVPGIVGAMYTTWEDKFDAMEAWAKRAWGE
jgi:hypothetical protein